MSPKTKNSILFQIFVLSDSFLECLECACISLLLLFWTFLHPMLFLFCLIILFEFYLVIDFDVFWFLFCLFALNICEFFFLYDFWLFIFLYEISCLLQNLIHLLNGIKNFPIENFFTFKILMFSFKIVILKLVLLLLFRLSLEYTIRVVNSLSI